MRQAEKLRSKAQRPEVSRSTHQLCRYLYYLGRIRAIQLEYTEAKDCLQQALRKVHSAHHRQLVNHLMITFYHRSVLRGGQSIAHLRGHM